MRLVQYRFSLNARERASFIGDAIQSFFARAGDLNLRALYVEKGSPDRLAVKPIGAERISEVVAACLVQSFSKYVDYSKPISINSNISCRFLCFEDDGLLRICHAHSDTPIKFDGLQYSAEDVSHLLTQTDLFDYS